MVDPAAPAGKDRNPITGDPSSLGLLAGLMALSLVLFIRTRKEN